MTRQTGNQSRREKTTTPERRCPRYKRTCKGDGEAPKNNMNNLRDITKNGNDKMKDKNVLFDLTYTYELKGSRSTRTYKGAAKTPRIIQTT